MIDKRDTLTIDLDGKYCEVEPGLTILEAARRHGVYVPTLCAHKDLVAFGACRMCLVEVEGMRGFPTACTTPVQNGMVVRTDTPKVRELRLEVLRLTLSQHPCGCIVCDENEECKTHSPTTRKTGRTTGCGTCPKTGSCELKEVAERVGLDRIDLPVYYRDLPLEKYDPFYDRDYNLCILCGRCVRICQDVRTAGTLALLKRGGRTIVGPAYGRTHMEAGCEFCGSCVSACPTGALSEKVNKWDGAPDREEITTCPLCGVGCQAKILVKDGKVVGSLPAEDPIVSDGHLCVKGRFCFPEIVNDHRRLREPQALRGAAKIEIAWESAIKTAAEKLAVCRSGRFAMLVSPNCTNEDLYVAQKFTRVAMLSNNVDTGARVFYGQGFDAYVNLTKMSASLSDIRKATAVLAVGLDTRFGGSVVGVELRKALRRDAKLITIHPEVHGLSRISDAWLRPAPDFGIEYLESFVRAVDSATRKRTSTTAGSEAPDGELSEAAGLLVEAIAPLILVGTAVVHHRQSARILETIERLARSIGARVLTLPAQNNLVGSILMGAYPELLPGGWRSSDKKRIAALEDAWGAKLTDPSPGWTSELLTRGADLDVLYLIGENPTDGRPPAAQFVIYQNVSPPPAADYADLVLPAAAFTEVDGTFVSGEGRVQRVTKAVVPPGEALPDWEVLCRLAREMGVGGFEFKNVRDVHDEIASLVPGFGGFDALERGTMPFVCEGRMTADRTASTLDDEAAPRDHTEKSALDYPFVLTAAVEEHTYRGYPISCWVGGAKEIFPAECLSMGPREAERARIRDGDEVVVWSDGLERRWRARIVAEQSDGSLRVTLPGNRALAPTPIRVNMRKADV